MEEHHTFRKATHAVIFTGNIILALLLIPVIFYSRWLPDLFISHLNIFSYLKAAGIILVPVSIIVSVFLSLMFYKRERFYAAMYIIIFPFFIMIISYFLLTIA